MREAGSDKAPVPDEGDHLKILLFTGAGASIELGIPGMRRMVEDFHAELRNLGLSTHVIRPFEDMLVETDYDMEALMEHVESVERGQQSQISLGFGADETLLKTTRAIRWEAEWFVQHVCERLRALDARTLWGPMLRQKGDHDLCIATTNYDRSIEVACRSWGVPFDDGFEELSDAEIAGWRGPGQWTEGALRLLKIHGSTDWYRGDDGRVYKLRHPMPLYGDLALSHAGMEGKTGSRMTSSLILPTREKRTTLPPYPDLITDFRTFARETETAIFVGTSLRDPDLYDVCDQCAQRGIPTYFVTVDSDLDIPMNAKKVVETASGFLASTLPRFLACGDPEFLNACSSGSQRIVGAQSILGTLVLALDRGNEPDIICRAIDGLVDNGVMLDSADIKQLLSNEDVAVRKYALALIPQSVDREELLTEARGLAKSDEDTFRDELRMMEELIESLAA